MFAWEYTEWRNGISNGDTIAVMFIFQLSDISYVVW